MLRDLAFLVLMIIALRGVFVSPIGALLAYLWVDIFRPQSWVWFDVGNLSLIMGLLLVARSLGARVWPNLTHRLSLGMLLFLVTGLIAQVHAVNPDISWTWIWYFCRLYVVCVFLIGIVDSPRRFLYTIMVISTSIGYYTAKAGLFSIAHGGLRYAAGLPGSFVDNNAYALAGVMIVPLLGVVAGHVPEDWRFRQAIVWGYRAAVPLTCLTVVSTFSREGFLALLTALIVYLALTNRKRALVWVAILAVAVPCVRLLPLPAGYSDRLDTILNFREVQDESALSRLYFWHVAADMAIHNPLGVGMFGFNYAFDKYDTSDGRYGRARSVHNSHLQALTENGFDGFVVWIYMFVAAIRACLRVRSRATRELAGTAEGKLLRASAVALISSMAAFFVGGSFIAFCLNELTWITFALAASLELVCVAAVRERNPGAGAAKVGSRLNRRPRLLPVRSRHGASA